MGFGAKPQLKRKWHFTVIYLFINLRMTYCLLFFALRKILAKSINIRWGVEWGCRGTNITGADGTYFVQVLDGDGNLVVTKYLVLN